MVGNMMELNKPTAKAVIAAVIPTDRLDVAVMRKAPLAHRVRTIAGFALRMTPAPMNLPAIANPQ